MVRSLTRYLIDQSRRLMTCEKSGTVYPYLFTDMEGNLLKL